MADEMKTADVAVSVPDVIKWVNLFGAAANEETQKMDSKELKIHGNISQVVALGAMYLRALKSIKNPTFVEQIMSAAEEASEIISMLRINDSGEIVPMTLTDERLKEEPVKQ